MVGVLRREKPTRGRSKLVRIQLIFSGDSYSENASTRANELSLKGYDFAITHGNGCVQLEYKEDRRQKPILHEYDGEMLTLAAIANRIGIDRSTIYRRVAEWGLSKAVQRPKMQPDEVRKNFLKLLFSSGPEIGSP